MAVYVKDAVGLMNACRELKGWPAGRKGVTWLAKENRCDCDLGNLSKALRGDGAVPLPTNAVKWLGAALESVNRHLRDYVEERGGRRKTKGPTAIALPDGHSAFELLRERALEAKAKVARMVVWSCEISKHTVKSLVECGCSVELVVSRPLSHVKQSEHDNKFRTSSIFLFKSALDDAVTRSESRGSVHVFGYPGFVAPFRGLHVPEVGLAIGVYQKERREGGRATNIYGDELPAIFIARQDPAYREWAKYFDEAVKSLKAGEPAIMVVDASGSRILDGPTRTWIEKLSTL